MRRKRGGKWEISAQQLIADIQIQDEGCERMQDGRRDEKEINFPLVIYNDLCIHLTVCVLD